MERPAEELPYRRQQPMALSRLTRITRSEQRYGVHAALLEALAAAARRIRMSCSAPGVAAAGRPAGSQRGRFARRRWDSTWLPRA
jgi:hypothetical protein